MDFKDFARVIKSELVKAEQFFVIKEQRREL